MINDLCNAIKTTLKAKYPTFNVYTEAGSTIEEPAFIISIENYKNHNELKPRGLITVAYEIICRVGSSSSQFSYYDIALDLDECLDPLLVSNEYYHATEQAAEFGTELKYKLTYEVPYLITKNNEDTIIASLKNLVNIQ